MWKTKIGIYRKLWKMRILCLVSQYLRLHRKTILTNYVGLGGLGVMCSPRDPRFAGSNPAEVEGLFQNVKILSISLPGRTLSWGSRV